MSIETTARQVFNVAEEKENVITPPKQVFANPNFKFLFRQTRPFHLTDNEEDYQKLMHLLREIGETEFYVLENIGATISEPERTLPHQATIPVNSNYDYFTSETNSFDIPPPLEFLQQHPNSNYHFQFSINHFFIFGKNPKWGIYICENPMLHIIGCTEELLPKFSEVYKFEDYGLPELNKFIAQELRHNTDWIIEMVGNYNLENYLQT